MHTYGGTHGLQEQLPLGAQCVMLIIWQVWKPIHTLFATESFLLQQLEQQLQEQQEEQQQQQQQTKQQHHHHCVFVIFFCRKRRAPPLYMMMLLFLFAVLLSSSSSHTAVAAAVPIVVCSLYLWMTKKNISILFQNVTEKKWYGTPRGVVAPTQGPGEGPDSVLATSERVHLCTSDEVAFKFKSTFEIKTVQYILYRPPFFFFDPLLLRPYCT